jgi:hypothetical protein
MKIICAAGKAPQVVDFFRCESDFAATPKCSYTNLHIKTCPTIQRAI